VKFYGCAFIVNGRVIAQRRMQALVVVLPLVATELLAEIKQIQLRWTRSIADAGYVIMRNGKAAGLTMSTTWTDVAWSAGDATTYNVIATDFAGRASAPSNTATVRLSRRK
jgi:hypothetical protein